MRLDRIQPEYEGDWTGMWEDGGDDQIERRPQVQLCENNGNGNFLNSPINNIKQT